MFDCVSVSNVFNTYPSLLYPSTCTFCYTCHLLYKLLASPQHSLYLSWRFFFLSSIELKLESLNNCVAFYFIFLDNILSVSRWLQWQLCLWICNWAQRNVPQEINSCHLWRYVEVKLASEEKYEIIYLAQRIENL